MYHSIFKSLYPDFEIYSAGYKVRDKVITIETRKVLNDNNIELIKNMPNKTTDYEKEYFEDIIVLDKEFDINKTKLKYNNLKLNYIRDPYEEDMSVYVQTLEEIKEIIKKNNL